METKLSQAQLSSVACTRSPRLGERNLGVDRLLIAFSHCRPQTLDKTVFLRVSTKLVPSFYFQFLSLSLFHVEECRSGCE